MTLSVAAAAAVEERTVAAPSSVALATRAARSRIAKAHSDWPGTAFRSLAIAAATAAKASSTAAWCEADDVYSTATLFERNAGTLRECKGREGGKGIEQRGER